MISIVQGANIVKRELGLPESPATPPIRRFYFSRAETIEPPVAALFASRRRFSRVLGGGSEEEFVVCSDYTAQPSDPVDDALKVREQAGQEIGRGAEHNTNVNSEVQNIIRGTVLLTTVISNNWQHPRDEGSARRGDSSYGCTRSIARLILPVCVFGNSLTNSTARGYL